MSDEQAKRMAEQPAPGMKADGTLTVLEPGEPIPQAKIILPDGSVLEGQDVAGMTDADFAAMVDLGDEEDDDLRAAYEATGEVEDDE